MTHISLFSGVGGLDLSAEWAGFETVLQVEKDPYCLKVLAKHWPDVRRIEDIHDVKGDEVEQSVTVISGGSPCQPASTAGKRGGRSDDRWLWPEFARVVELFLPKWIMAENPTGILSLEDGVAIEEWLARMEAQGYTFLPPLVYPLAALGADHRRYRVFYVAHLDGEHGNPCGYGTGEICGKRSSATKLQESEIRGSCDTSINRDDSKIAPYLDSRRWGESSGKTDSIQGAFHSTKREESSSGVRSSSQDATDSSSGGWHERESNTGGSGQGTRTEEESGSGFAYCRWWDDRSRLLRMVHGVRGRMDGHRIRALGNSVSPQQAYPIFKAIAEVERCE